MPWGTLENIGTSITLALFWFYYIPTIVSGLMGIGYRRGFGYALFSSAIVVFVLGLVITFNIKLTGTEQIFTWHVVGFLLSFLGINIITKLKRNLFVLVLATIILISLISHSIQLFELLPLFQKELIK